MNATDTITAEIKRFEEGYVFSYKNLDSNSISENNLKSILSRLVSSGKIVKPSKGRFYKKTAGYITGYTVFNQLKLTTQVSNIIQIGVSFDRKELKRLDYRIKFVRQWNVVTKKNIPLLQLLDCFRFIKDIPDTTVDASLLRLKILIEELSEE